MLKRKYFLYFLIFKEINYKMSEWVEINEFKLFK